MILNFSGKNQVLMLDKMKFNIINLFVFSRIKIKGKNNKIIFRGDFKLSNFFNVLSNLKLVICGDNNLVDIEFPIIFRNATISLSKDNNIFKIKRTEHKLKDAFFYIEDGGIVDIGESSQLGMGICML